MELRRKADVAQCLRGTRHIDFCTGAILLSPRGAAVDPVAKSLELVNCPDVWTQGYVVSAGVVAARCELVYPTGEVVDFYLLVVV